MGAVAREAEGYVVIAASAFEVGLTKNGRGVKTWWNNHFKEWPTLDHPDIQRAILDNEQMEELTAERP